MIEYDDERSLPRGDRDASEPISVRSLGGELLLTDDEFDELSPDEQGEYLALLETHLARWSLEDNPRQLLAEAVAPHVDILLFGGAAGGGKSEWLCYHAWQLSERFPGHASLLLRTSLPELRRSLIRRMQIRFAELGVKVKLRRNDNLTAFYFPNGSLIEAGFCSADEDVAKYLSAEYDFIGFDEGSKFTPYAIKMINSRARTTTVKAKAGVRPHVAIATNPGGRAHNFLRKLIISATGYGESIAVYDVEHQGLDVEDVLEGKITPARLIPAPQTAEEAEGWTFEREPESELTVAFVKSLVSDNPHIDTGYKKMLRSLDGIERRQYLEGDWDAIEGRAFPDFDRAVHVEDEFAVPDGWWRARGLDYGWSAPFVCLWGAWDDDGVCHIYREAKLVRYTAQDQAREVLRRSRHADGRVEAVSRTAADRSTHNRIDAGPSIAEQWRTAGLNTAPANNARKMGWANVHEYLRVDPDTGRPKLVVSRACPYLLETLGTLESSRTDPEDVDTHADDHACDALRYLLLLRPIRAKRVQSHREEAYDLNARLQRHVKRLSKTRGGYS